MKQDRPDTVVERRELGHGAQVVRVRQATNAHEDRASEDLVVGLTVGGTARVRWSYSDRWRETPQRRPGDLGVSRLGEPAQFQVSGRSEQLLVSIPRRHLNALFEESGSSCPSDFGPFHEAYQRDRTLRDGIRTLWMLGAGTSPFVSLEIDGTLRALVARLAGKARGPGRPASLRLTLSDPEAARLEAFVRAHLSPALTVPELAGVLGLTSRQLHTAISTRFGTSPAAWVRQIRVQVAAEHIAAGGRLSEVAAATGFSDQSHMGRVFQGFFGRTPGSFRPGAGE